MVSISPSSQAVMHVVIASTAAELACSAARWRGAGAPVTEKASSEAALWLTALGRGVYCVRAGPLRTGSPIFAVWMLTALLFTRVPASQGALTDDTSHTSLKRWRGRVHI